MAFYDTKQRPLTSPRNGHEHDFSLTEADWEAAVFDQAAFFAVIEFRHKRRYTQWKTFPWAVRYAKPRTDAGLYAVTASGRFVLLERVVWDQWEQRWREGRD